MTKTLVSKLKPGDYNKLLLLTVEYVKHLRSYNIKINLNNARRDNALPDDNFNSVTEKLVSNIYNFCKILELPIAEVFDLKSKDRKVYDYLIIATFVYNMNDEESINNNKRENFITLFNSLYKILHRNNPNLNVIDIITKEKLKILT